MADEYKSYFDLPVRCDKWPPMKADSNGLYQLYPNEIFCRFNTSDEEGEVEFCRIYKPFSTTGNLRKHLLNCHLDETQLAPLRKGTSRARETERADYFFDAMAKIAAGKASKDDPPTYLEPTKFAKKVPAAPKPKKDLRPKLQYKPDGTINAAASKRLIDYKGKCESCSAAKITCPSFRHRDSGCKYWDSFAPESSSEEDEDEEEE